NRGRARSLGIDVKAYELAVYTIAAVFAGVAGGLYAVYQGQAFPQMLYWTENATPVVITLLGGTGAFLGPALGAFVYTELNNAVSVQFPYQFDVVLGAIVLLIVLVAPGGFASLPRLFWELRRRFRRRDAAAAAPAEESAGEAISRIDVGRALRTDAIDAGAVE